MSTSEFPDCVINNKSWNVHVLFRKYRFKEIFILRQIVQTILEEVKLLTFNF